MCVFRELKLVTIPAYGRRKEESAGPCQCLQRVKVGHHREEEKEEEARVTVSVQSAEDGTL